MKNVPSVCVFNCISIGCITQRWAGTPKGLASPGQGKGEGPAGDKWSETTKETVGGDGVSEANGALRECPHIASPDTKNLLGEVAEN